MIGVTLTGAGGFSWLTIPSVVTTLRVAGTKFLAGFLLKMYIKSFLLTKTLFTYLENICKKVHLIVTGI